MLLKPLCFGWHKILPILYDQYLSETEILNMIISRFNDFIEQINKLGDNNDELSNYIAELSKELETVKVSVKTVRNDVLKLKELHEKDIKKIYNLLDETNKKIDDNDASIRSLIDKEIDDIVSLIESKTKRIYLDMQILESNMQLKIDMLETKFPELKNTFVKMLSNQWVSTLHYVNKKLNELSSETIYVFNPYNGKKQTLQDFINYISEKDSNGLTAYEYRMLNLTAYEYRMLNLTAYEYRVYGIHHVDSIDYQEKQLRYDLFGYKRLNPISSVFDALEGGVDATMDGYDLTAEEYRQWSDIYEAYMLDRYGKYILSNNYPAYMHNTVRVVGDTWIQTSDSETGEVTTLLKMPIDRIDINQIDLLNDLSINTLVLNFEPELVPPEITGYTFTGEYYSVGFNLINKRYQLVDGGIAFNAIYQNRTYGIYENENGDTKNVLIPATIDFNGITTV